MDNKIKKKSKVVTLKAEPMKINPEKHVREAGLLTKSNLAYFKKYHKNLTPTFLDKFCRPQLGEYTFVEMDNCPAKVDGWIIAGHTICEGKLMIFAEKKKKRPFKTKVTSWFEFQDFLDLEPAKLVYYVYKLRLFYEDERWEKVNKYFEKIKCFDESKLTDPVIHDKDGSKFRLVFANKVSAAVMGLDESGVEDELKILKEPEIIDLCDSSSGDSDSDSDDDVEVAEVVNDVGNDDIVEVMPCVSDDEAKLPLKKRRKI